MVGHELPNFRPMGEDHPGASGGNMRRARGTTAGGVMTGVSKKWMNLILVSGWPRAHWSDGVEALVRA